MEAIIQFLQTPVANGLYYWHLAVLGLLIASFIPVSHGLVKRTKKMMGKTSESAILLISAAVIYFYFTEGLQEVFDRAFGTIMFSGVLIFMFIIWQWKGVKK